MESMEDILVVPDFHEVTEKFVEQAAKDRADLIVEGSDGHSLLYSALVGSVSEGILRKAPWPVLIVPAR